MWNLEVCFFQLPFHTFSSLNSEIVFQESWILDNVPTTEMVIMTRWPGGQRAWHMWLCGTKSGGLVAQTTVCLGPAGWEKEK